MGNCERVQVQRGMWDIYFFFRYVLILFLLLGGINGEL